jgi:Transglycosylase SLT domain
LRKRLACGLMALMLGLLHGCSGGKSVAGGDAGGGSGGGGGSSGSSGGTSSSSGSGSSGSSSGGLPDDAGPVSFDGGACSPDPLHTGLTAQQTGVSVDAFDCAILQWTAAYGEPDAMVFKAIIYVESRFDQLSVACPNDPCGTPAGWTAQESGCFGLMQVVPACHDDPGDAGLLGNGQPNMTTDPSSSGWAGSIFNPEVNIQIGIAGVAGNRAQVEKQFPGCTVDQYTMMAVGNYNDYGSTTSCTQYNSAYDTGVIAAYQQYASAAGWAAHSYSP